MVTEDVSRKTIMVLVLLTLLISVLGVMIVSHEISLNVKGAEETNTVRGTPTNDAQVSLRIINPPTARVALDITDLEAQEGGG